MEFEVQLEIKNGHFYLGGEKINIYSGTVQYFRIHQDCWEDRLTKLKAAGFNTVETYAPWNLHEPRKEQFDFSHGLDVERFIRTAQKVGLYVIFRPGPYICAEWDFGGFPAWLLKEKDISLRCSTEPYMTYCKRYLRAILEKVKPYLITNGGNVIILQVENEYGSFGNDKQYLAALRDFYIDCGIDVPLITSDGDWDDMLSGGTVDGCLPTLNFGSKVEEHYQNFRKRYGEDIPFMCTEFWIGWFDHWGDSHHTRSEEDMRQELEALLRIDASFNMYVFCGGTNFGFTAGSNFTDRLCPTVTSYDYCALLDERGDYTKNYYIVRDILLKHQNLPVMPLPKVLPTQDIGFVELTDRAELSFNKDTIGYTFHSVEAGSIEQYGFSHGLIEYTTVLPGRYYDGSNVNVTGIADRAYISFDGIPAKVFDRTKEPGQEVNLPLRGGENTVISILVDSFGHINYGRRMADPKGISGIYVAEKKLFHYDVVCYPLDNLDKLSYNGGSRFPLFLRGYFSALSKKDCFVRLDGFTKGMVWVNGTNLGRYWNEGPQKTLYLPKEYLLDKNEIIVLELECYEKPAVELCAQNDLG